MFFFSFCFVLLRFVVVVVVFVVVVVVVEALLTALSACWELVHRPTKLIQGIVCSQSLILCV